MNSIYESKLNANDYYSKRLHEAEDYRRARKLNNRRPYSVLLNALISIFS